MPCKLLMIFLPRDRIRRLLNACKLLILEISGRHHVCSFCYIIAVLLQLLQSFPTAKIYLFYLIKKKKGWSSKRNKLHITILVESENFSQLMSKWNGPSIFSIGGYTPISLISLASAAFFPVASSHFLMAAFIVVGITNYVST